MYQAELKGSFNWFTWNLMRNEFVIRCIRGNAMNKIIIKVLKGAIEAPLQLCYDTEDEHVRIMDLLFDYGYTVRQCDLEEWSNSVLSSDQEMLLMEVVDDVREITDVQCEFQKTI